MASAAEGDSLSNNSAATQRDEIEGGMLLWMLLTQSRHPMRTVIEAATPKSLVLDTYPNLIRTTSET
jgi:hypothetical protein